MDLTGIISLVLNLVFGGGLFVTLLTLKSTKVEAEAKAEKAKAEAKTTEIDNVGEVAKMWRELTEQFKAEQDGARQDYIAMSTQVTELRKEVTKLANINKQMVKLLDKITPENLQEMIDKIKKIHENE